MCESVWWCIYHTVRQLEQQVKLVLDSISADSDRKRELIRGEAVDKAEQLSEPLFLRPLCSVWALIAFCLSSEQVRLIQESLDTFRDALSKQQKQWDNYQLGAWPRIRGAVSSNLRLTELLSWLAQQQSPLISSAIIPEHKCHISECVCTYLFWRKTKSNTHTLHSGRRKRGSLSCSALSTASPLISSLFLSLSALILSKTSLTCCSNCRTVWYIHHHTLSHID